MRYGGPKKNKGAVFAAPLEKVAEWTGLEPATPGVTGRYSNRLNYHSAFSVRCEGVFPQRLKLGGC